MALFGKKKETKESAASSAPTGLATDRNLHGVLIRPHFTEKSVNMGEENVYTFEVRRDATKFEVRDAVKALYKVTPVKVNIVNKRPAHRPKGSLNRKVKVAGMKKAYVYLKKGDSITLA
ncbi:MAG TPA: 50S ribosomal protein L23 [Candidatus Paceibacterota bacterium]